MFSVLATLAFLIAGCQKQQSVAPPVTFPVSGKVMIGSRPAPAGTLVQFEPKNRNLRAQGVVGVEGNFSLFVISHSERFEGATAGIHRAMVVLPLTQDRKGGERITVDGIYVVEPRPTEFVLRIK